MKELARRFLERTARRDPGLRDLLDKMKANRDEKTWGAAIIRRLGFRAGGSGDVRAAEALLKLAYPETASTRFEVSGPDGGPIETRDLSREEILERAQAAIRRLQGA